MKKERECFIVVAFCYRIHLEIVANHEELVGLCDLSQAFACSVDVSVLR
jgi:hypothetical protein